MGRKENSCISRSTFGHFFFIQSMLAAVRVPNATMNTARRSYTYKRSREQIIISKISQWAHVIYTICESVVSAICTMIQCKNNKNKKITYFQWNEHEKFTARTYLSNVAGWPFFVLIRIECSKIPNCRVDSKQSVRFKYTTHNVVARKIELSYRWLNVRH